MMPYVFSGTREPKLIYPGEDEENLQLLGHDVTIEPQANGPALCVKAPVMIHDYGPPDLMCCRFHRLVGGKLAQVDERLAMGNHFNQVLNAAGYAFQRGDFLKALDLYQTTIASYAQSMPTEAKAEAWLYLGETRKFLKDFPGALAAFEKVGQEFVECPQCEQALREGEFIAANLGSDTVALSLYVDVARLKNLDKVDEAFALLTAQLPQLPASNMLDHLLFLKAELLVAQNRVDEALATFKDVQKRFPQTPLLEEIRNNINELSANQDEAREGGDPQ